MNGPLLRSAEEWWEGQQHCLNNIDQVFSVVLSSSDELVGVCGFLHGQESCEWEIWLLLRTKFWRRGFGKELTSSLMKVAFTSLFARRVIGIVHPQNYASINMIKKLGFVFLKRYEKQSSWQSGHHVYGIELDKYTLTNPI